MEISRLRTRTQKRRHRASGFSLLEMMMVVAIIIILATISFISLVPLLKQQRVTNAYNTTLGAFRLARDNAVSKRTSYSVTFASTSTSNTITVAPTLTGGFQGQDSSTVYTLPSDVAFTALTGLPATGTPDNYGSGTTAIDLGYTASSSGGSSVVYFCPDGTSQDAAGGAGQCTGNWSGGVVYIARQGELLSSRAITLWGGTGRVRGWRLYPNTSGGYQWLRQ